MSISMTVETLQNVARCPRCNVSFPSFRILGKFNQVSLEKQGQSGWHYYSGLYKCTTCDRCVVAESVDTSSGTSSQILVEHLLPLPDSIDPLIDGKSFQFLSDALASLNAPTASIMASCSAIDAMLKDRGIGRRNDDGKERSLHGRLKDAVSEGVLTQEMADWGHRIRLDANDQRHADEEAELPTSKKASEILDLAKGLAEVLFVLPAKAKIDSEAEPNVEV